MKISSERNYFDNPDLYLRSRSIIMLRSDIARDALGEIREMSILDLGCGDGAVSRQFLERGNHVTFVDKSLPMLELAKLALPEGVAPLADFVNKDVLEAPREQYDCVICLGVIAHVESAIKVVRIISERLVPGGRCLIQFTDSSRPFSMVMRLFAWCRRFGDRLQRGYGNVTSSAEIIEMFRECNMSKVDSWSYSIGVPGLNRVVSVTYLYRWAKWTMRTKGMDACNTEVVMLFEKNRV